MSIFCVTGAAGFIGSHTVDLLIDQGHTVSGIDDFSTGRVENLNPKLDFVQGTILDPHLLRRAMAGADHVIHLAARPSVAKSIEDPNLTNLVNVAGTLAVLEMARELGVKRVVVASSSSVYGNAEPPPKIETMRCAPESPYAVSKLATEAYAAAYWKTFKLEAVALRYFNVYGPRQRADSGYAAVMPAFVKACLTGAKARLDGDGLQTRDFTFVKDVARANLAACTAPISGARVPVGEAYNICNGDYETSIRDLLGLVSVAVGKPFSGIDEAPARSGDVRRSRGDRRKAAYLLEWTPRVHIKNGVLATVEAMRKELDK